MLEAVAITEARKRFLDLVNEVSGGAKKVLLTKHGRPAAVMLGAGEYYQMRETLDLLLHRDEVRIMAKGLAELRGEEPEA